MTEVEKRPERRPETPPREKRESCCTGKNCSRFCKCAIRLANAPCCILNCAAGILAVLLIVSIVLGIHYGWTAVDVFNKAKELADKFPGMGGSGSKT